MLDPHMPSLSDEDVGKVFKTALEARLRHAIAAETKHRRVRSEQSRPRPDVRAA
jgi:DNA repair photolyase